MDRWLECDFSLPDDEENSEVEGDSDDEQPCHYDDDNGPQQDQFDPLSSEQPCNYEYDAQPANLDGKFK